MRVVEFGEVEQKVREQLMRCATGDAVAAVLCADNHLGYSMPIGGAIAYRSNVSPSGVGYDIACGNKAVRTGLHVEAVEPEYVSWAMDEIVDQVSFGIGRNNKEEVDHPVLSEIAGHHMPEVRKMGWMAAGQLGTVGAGNHYVDLFVDEEEFVWVGVHFGSRGFGHKAATGFLNLVSGRDWDVRFGESMDAPPTLIPADTALGQDYVSVMEIAGRYAYAGRDWVCAKVLDILKTQEMESVHNHHNFAWREDHFGERVWVVRKGCTPAFPGQRSFIGASMGEPAFIIEGLDAEKSREALYSTVHGAGRAMSRNEAAGKKKWVKGTDGRKRVTRVGGGRIDWTATVARIAAQGIELRGGAADEAPGAYKRLNEVIAYHADTIRIVHTLTPIGVAMAGDEVDDPYKD